MLCALFLHSLKKPSVIKIETIFYKNCLCQSDHNFFLSKTFFSFQKKPNYLSIYLIFNITLCVLNMILMTILILHLVQCFPSTLASTLHLNNLTYFINAFGIPMHVSLNLFFIYTGIFSLNLKQLKCTIWNKSFKYLFLFKWFNFTLWLWCICNISHSTLTILQKKFHSWKKWKRTNLRWTYRQTNRKT